jgi:hypothetical protein
MHHSNYFRLFEEARGELLRSLGIPYSKLREEGYEVVLLEAEFYKLFAFNFHSNKNFWRCTWSIG